MFNLTMPCTLPLAAYLSTASYTWVTLIVIVLLFADITENIHACGMWSPMKTV